MTIIGWFSRRPESKSLPARLLGAASAIAVAVLVMTAGTAAAQTQTPGAPIPTPNLAPVVPAGYSLHQSVDIGGHVANIYGSGAMYDTLVNQQSGPRMLGQTFELRALPGNKHPLFDSMTGFSSGYGGDPVNFSKLTFSKGKLYEFSGLFRRDRQYFDYDLLGNPNIPGGYSVPIGPSTSPTGSYAWPQDLDSPFMFNTVRRMTDTSLTLLPLSVVSFHAGYSQNIFQGPSLTPSGNSVAGSEVLLQEYQRNSADDFTGGMDWKPIQGTKLTFEEQIDHYKGDSYFTMDPSFYTVQEADGTKVALLDSYQTFLPYGYTTINTGTTSAPIYSASFNNSGCNTTSMGSTPLLTANPAGGLPIVNAACNVITSYYRAQPTRELFPTEIFRLQSTSIKNVEMNGNLRYTSAKMNLPYYNEAFQGLDKASRVLAYTASANARRQVLAADYGVVWQAGKNVSIADQISFSNAHQPGSAEFLSGTTVTVPTTAGEETINYTPNPSTTVTTGSAPFEGSPAIGAASPGYFGLRLITNNATVSWNATPRSTFSFTYRTSNRVVTEGENVSTPVESTTCPTGWLQAYCGTVTINENGGIFNAALRPTDNWDLNGTVEMFYADNVFTPVAPRQTKHYRVHTIFRPKPWATISGAFNDLERHNNTNNTGTPVPSYLGDLDHVDHSRVVSFGADLAPSEHYGFDLNYAYSDVYTATNTCMQGQAIVMPGGTVAPAAATQSGTLCTAISAGHSTGSYNLLFVARDFSDAPTQYASVALALSPATKLHSDIGYRVSAVNGSRLFTDAGDVNGSLVSTYQSPFVNLAYTLHPGLIWKAEYNFYGYGEGGPSGAQYCNDNPNLASGAAGSTVPVVPCSSLPNTAMSGPAYGFTAPRNFHANNVTLGLHYEF